MLEVEFAAVIARYKEGLENVSSLSLSVVGGNLSCMCMSSYETVELCQ
jgi:hypothetical protein